VPVSVKVTCPQCGHVRVAAREIRLVVPADATGSFYRFRCPSCSLSVRRPAVAPVVAALQDSGAVVVRST
jgi:ribosomal protein S27E